MENRVFFRYYVILFSLLLLPNCLVALYSTDIQGSFIKIMAYLLLSISLWLCLLLIVSVRRFFTIGLFFLLLSPIEVGVTKLTGTPISIGFIDAIFDTNYQETKEQVWTQIGILPYFIVVISLYIYFLNKIPRKIYLVRKYKFGIAGFFIILNLLLYAQMIRLQSDEEKSTSLILNSAFWSWQRKYLKIYPSNVFLCLYFSLTDRYESLKTEEAVKDFSFQATKTNDEEEIVVLVIGESARYSQLEINGYHRPTTPLLKNEKDLISYSNVYSEAVLTSVSVPLILTRATPTHKELQYYERTLPEAFGEAGFSTYIISTQGAFIPLIRRVQRNVDEAVFLDIGENVLDEAVLPEFERVLHSDSKSKFIIIHTLGSHMSYEYRYSKSFNRFSPTSSFKSEMQAFEMDDDKKQELINAYDNSVLYTDWVLSRLINILKKKNAKSSLLYVSDHAENLFDDGKTIGHGSENPKKVDLHIPFLLWLSPEFQDKSPETYRNLKLNQAQKATTESVFYTLLDVGGIKISEKYYKPSKSLATDKYIAPKRRTALNTQKEVVEVN